MEQDFGKYAFMDSRHAERNVLFTILERPHDFKLVALALTCLDDEFVRSVLNFVDLARKLVDDDYARHGRNTGIREIYLPQPLDALAHN
jgi:hypothetical protein